MEAVPVTNWKHGKLRSYNAYLQQFEAVRIAHLLYSVPEPFHYDVIVMVAALNIEIEQPLKLTVACPELVRSFDSHYSKARLHINSDYCSLLLSG